MAKRKAISKKTRFEVFKRDSFTCQYCGKSVPEVILNVDHIRPVIHGGDNDVLNLITACFDCNSGKGDRELSDSTVVTKQMDQLKILNERKTQIEMVSRWRDELTKHDDIQIETIRKLINEQIKQSNKVVGDGFLKTEMKSCLKKYGFVSLCEAIEKSSYQYLKDPCSTQDRDKFYNMISRICYWQKREQENPEEAELRKIAYTANKRWSWCNVKSLQHDLIRLRRDGLTIKEIYQFVILARGLTHFEKLVAEHLEGRSDV